MPKVLTMAIQREPGTIGITIGESSVAGGAANADPIAHNSLTAEFETNKYRYWEVAPILMLKGINGPRAVRNQVTVNIFEWTKE